MKTVTVNLDFPVDYNLLQIQKLPLGRIMQRIGFADDHDTLPVFIEGLRSLGKIPEYQPKSLAVGLPDEQTVREILTFIYANPGPYAKLRWFCLTYQSALWPIAQKLGWKKEEAKFTFDSHFYERHF